MATRLSFACASVSPQGNTVFYIVDSDKSFSEATFDLEPVIQRLGFVILHAHDLGEVLRRKGIDFDDECKVFDICNYRQMANMLAIDMRLSAILPWRISVFTENGATRIGLLRPQPMLAALCQNAGLARPACEMEEKMVHIVDATR